MANLEERINYHDEISFVPKQNSVIIFDVADEHIFSNPKGFKKLLTKNQRCICLTATSDSKSNIDGVERKILDYLGIKVFDDRLYQGGGIDLLGTYSTVQMISYEDRLIYLKE